MMSMVIRITMKMARRMPSLVRFKIHQCQMVSPGVQKRLMTPVKTRIMRTGLSPRKRDLGGTWLTAMHPASTRTMRP